MLGASGSNWCISAAGSEAPLGSESAWLDFSEGSLPPLLGTGVGLGKLGDPVFAGEATGVVGAGGSFTGVASELACCNAIWGFTTAGSEGSSDAPAGTMAVAVDKAIGGS